MAKYRQSDGQIVNFKPSDDAVPIDDTSTVTKVATSTGGTTTYNETPTTKNPLNAVTEQVTLGSTSPVLRFPLVDNPAYSGKIRFKLYRQNPLNFNLDALASLSVLDNVKSIFGSTTGERAKTELEIAAQDSRDEGNKARAQLASQQEEVRKGIAESFVSGLGIEEVEPNKLYEGSKIPSKSVEAELYFPLSVTMDDNVQYEGMDLAGIGTSILKGMQNQQTVTQAVANSVMSGLGNLFDFAFGGLADQTTAQYAAARYGKLGPQGVQTALTVAAQAAVNPNTRAIFRGVSIREFSFNFKMIPRSAKEAQEIAGIIQFFRSELYPEVFEIGETGLPLGYRFPNMFKIEFKHRDLAAKIPQLEYCFLRGVQSSYNPTGQSFHADGYPNEIDMTLRFQEHRALHKADIVKEGK
jgi:hypothetical protein